MAREPSYPEDTPVDGAGQPGREDAGAASTRTRQLVTGAAIGIGSAALVAALLYANRSRKGRDERK
jgi:hypothetical protein